MLVVAATADGEVGALGCDAVWGGLEDGEGGGGDEFAGEDVGEVGAGFWGEGASVRAE